MNNYRRGYQAAYQTHPQQSPNQIQSQNNMRRQGNRAQLLNYINEVSFAVVDSSLYLDTHPGDQNALEYFNEYSEKRKAALREYAKHYGPLTIDTANDTESDSWEWVEQPWPWEGGIC